jgi:rhodanese-related sulfurtransferase
MRNFFATGMICDGENRQLPPGAMDRLIEYFSHHTLIAFAAVVIAIAVAVYEMRTRGQNVAAISPQDLIRLMNQGALLIDLRSQEQFAAGHVAGARLMTGEQILKGAEMLKKYKEKVVVIYDDTGSLSASARRQLTAQGFTRAFNLRGGLAAWRSENLPLSKDPAPPKRQSA